MPWWMQRVYREYLEHKFAEQLAAQRGEAAEFGEAVGAVSAPAVSSSAEDLIEEDAQVIYLRAPG